MRRCKHRCWDAHMNIHNTQSCTTGMYLQFNIKLGTCSCSFAATAIEVTTVVFNLICLEQLKPMWKGNYVDFMETFSFHFIYTLIF